MRYLLTCCLFMASLPFLSAQGWMRSYLQDTARVQQMIKTTDKGFLMVSNNPQIDGIEFSKINEKGISINKKLFRGMRLFYTNTSFQIPTTTLNLCSDGDILTSVQIQDGLGLLKIDNNLEVRWSKPLSLTNPITKVSQNEIIVIGTSKATQKTTMIKLGLDGTIKSEITLSVPIFDFEIVADGIVAIGTESGLYKISPNGAILSTTPTGTLYPSFNHRFIKTEDGHFLIGIGGSDSFAKIDKNANILWQKPNIYKTPLVVPLSNGGFLAFTKDIYRNPDDVLILRYNSNGDSVTQKIVKDSFINQKIVGCFKADKNDFIYYGLFNPNNPNLTWGNTAFSVKIDSTGSFFPKSIVGYVKIDAAKNCSLTGNEAGLRNIILTATNPAGEIYRGISDEKGIFEIGLINGEYTVKPDLTSLSKYWSVCTPSVSAVVSDVKQPDTLFFAVKSLANLPLMQVDITTPFLRRCFNNSYFVSYCNKGTTKAENAYVNITLDSLLEYQSATRTLTSKTGNTYRFNLGNIEANDCQRFEITTRVRCGDSTRLGQTLCVKAKIYPDTSATPPTNWSGANITVKGSCIGDSAVFIIKNEGTAASKPLKAKAYLNEDVYESFNVQLPAQGVMTRKFKSDNKTWRITSEQEPNHPNSIRPTAFVDPCNREPILTLQSPALAFSSDDFALSLDEDCQQIRGSYDPNDKTGYPQGKKGIGQIPENQDIEYVIRFQNTGSDTAFTVVIKDTLPSVLDVSSIQWGSSSHPFKPSFEGKNVAIFTFNNILLVDSITNEPKSHGFVRFRIKQNLNLAKGTKIQNSAGIYFDFNPPIITNKTLHTIGVDEFTSPIFETHFTQLINVKVSPNPFTEKATIELEQPLKSNAQIEIFDITGKLIYRENIRGTQVRLDKKMLGMGLFIYKILEEGKLIAQGKLATQ